MQINEHTRTYVLNVTFLFLIAVGAGPFSDIMRKNVQHSMERCDPFIEGPPKPHVRDMDAPL